MTKSMVSRVWLAGLGLMAVGGIAALLAAAVGVPGLDPNDLQNRQYFLSEMSKSGGGFLVIVALVGVSVGLMIQFVGWILGMVTTATMKSWGWFAALLVVGAIGLEFFVMLAYVIWGPPEVRASRTLTPA